MLQVTSLLRSVLESDTIAPVLLVSIGFSPAVGGPIYITDAPRDITYLGNSYSADGGLRGLSPPKAENQVSRYLFDVSLGDPDGTYRALFNIESTGVPVTIVAGFVDLQNKTLYPDFLPIHAGKITNTAYTVESDSPVIMIQCSGPFLKLQQIINRVTTESSQKFYHPNDTSMDKSFDANNEEIKKWGGNG